MQPQPDKDLMTLFLSTTGGTNFGFMNGANYKGNEEYLPTITSYGKYGNIFCDNITLWWLNISNVLYLLRLRQSYIWKWCYHTEIYTNSQTVERVSTYVSWS